MQTAEYYTQTVFLFMAGSALYPLGNNPVLEAPLKDPFRCSWFQIRKL